MSSLSKKRFQLESGKHARCYRLVPWVLGLMVVTLIVHEVSDGSAVTLRQPSLADNYAPPQTRPHSKDSWKEEHNNEIQSEPKTATRGLGLNDHQRIRRNNVKVTEAKRHRKIKPINRGTSRLSDNKRARKQTTTSQEQTKNFNENFKSKKSNTRQMMDTEDGKIVVNDGTVVGKPMEPFPETKVIEGSKLGPDVSTGLKEQTRSGYNAKPIDAIEDAENEKRSQEDAMDRHQPMTGDREVKKIPAKDICEDTSKFNIQLVTEAFSKGYDDLDIKAYLTAYKELNRFFHLMGNVFSFVASDIDEKIGVMEKLLSSETNGKFYKTIESMIKYEEENQLLKKSNFVNGCRTLLRLHRALEFIGSFMLELSKAEYGDKTSTLAQNSYMKTLAKFHPWLLRKGGNVAMYALPTKGNLVAKVISEKCLKNDKQRIDLIMKEMADSAIKTYGKTQDLYGKHRILDLP